MENLRFAVVDVETTGGKPGVSRVIEIGIALVDDWKISGTFGSLVKTSAEISPFIENLTGITPKKLQNAPTFRDLSQKISRMLDGRIFVAHNVASDYGAISSEMRRCGLEFSPERLCTVKLSRRVFPGLSKYNLRELTASLGLPDFEAHRALNDAVAAAQILLLAHERFGPEPINELLRGGKRPLFYPKGFDEKRIFALPRTPGIVYFVGKTGILCATSARNARTRVVELLSSRRKNPLKGLWDGVVDIRVKELGSETLARLCLESELSRTRYPCNALPSKKSDVGAPLPDMAVFLPGRFSGDRAVVIVRRGKVLGYAFVDENESYSLHDILERLVEFHQTENLVPILRPALSRNGVQFIKER
jgi:DNA polymerase III epsilon subunit-like protein